ncbi:MAG: penicillin-binding protein, partial [Desulfobacterales bacterium]
ITGTWVGFDQGGSLGKLEAGSRAGSPIWVGFMQKNLAGKAVRVFPVPEGGVFAKIDAETGLLPIAESADTLFECFKEGTAPTAYAKRPGEVTEAEVFYKSGM